MFVPHGGCRRRQLGAAAAVAAAKSYCLWSFLLIKDGCIEAFMPATSTLRYTALTFTGQRCHDDAVLVSPPRSKARIRTTKMWSKQGNENEDDEFLEELYKTVAELDPEWYEDFVKNILGEDEVPFLPQQIQSATTEESSQQEGEVEAIRLVDNISPILEEIGETERESNVITEDESLGSTVTELSANIPLDPEINDQEEKFSIPFTPEETLTMTDSADSNQEKLQLEMLDVPIPNVVFQNEPVTESNDGAPTTVQSGKDEDDNLIVVYRDFYHKTLRSVPLTMLTKELEYDKEEIPYIQPDALDLIVRDGIRKPLRGVPQQWKISKNQYEYLIDDVRIVTSEQAKTLLAGNKESKQRSTTREQSASVTSDKDIEGDADSYKRYTEKSSVQKQKVVTDDLLKVLENLESVDRKQKPTKKESSKPATVVLERERTMSPEALAYSETSERLIKNTRDPTANDLPLRAQPTKTVKNSNSDQQELIPQKLSVEDEKVVLFVDRNSRKMRSVPLSVLVDLGYLAEDIVNIYPEALSWIVQDEIEKPRGGIPIDWKQQTLDPKIGQQEEADVIRVLSKSDAQRIIESSLEARVADASRQRQQQDPVKPKQAQERATGNGSVGSAPSKENLRSEDGPSRRRKEEMLPNETDRRRREAAAMKESAKRIYSGRDAKRPDESRRKPTTEDPPAPRLWPDFNTFRGLLRNEAEVRLRILGNGWADAVKEESDWRLGLYKEWLWTLHDGIGEPVVPSRRERERIRSYMNRGTPLAAPPRDDVPQSRRRSESTRPAPLKPKPPMGNDGDDEERRPRRTDRSNPRVSRRERDSRTRDD